MWSKTIIRFTLGILCSATLGATELQKVFYHVHSPQFNQDVDLSISRTVFYFSDAPVIKKTDQQGSISYFLPRVTMSAEAQQKIKELQTKGIEGFSLTINSVTKPAPGLLVQVTYNPKKMVVMSDTFDAISGSKGFEIRLYNKGVLDQLQKKEKSLLKVAHAPLPTVIIDCGHGGKDSGTIGCACAVEKEITLAVGKELAQALKAHNIPYVMTRADDQFVALDQRTLIANRLPEPTIFISLHANHAANSGVSGLETFCLNGHLFKKEMHELATAIDIIDTADQLLYTKSKQLAEHAHEHILKTAKETGYALKDRKVKYAASQVLMGVRCPSILIELEFLSNENAAHWLSDPKNQRHISNGISNGIIAFIRQQERN